MSAWICRSSISRDALSCGPTLTPVRGEILTLLPCALRLASRSETVGCIGRSAVSGVDGKRYSSEALRAAEVAWPGVDDCNRGRRSSRGAPATKAA